MVPDAVGDVGKASLTVVSGDPAGEAERADQVSEVDGLTVGNESDTKSSVGVKEVVSGAGRALDDAGGGEGDVGGAERNTSRADQTVRGQNPSGGAGAATVGGGLVDDAVGDPDQARGAVAGEAGEGGVAQNAQAEAVILDAVDDGPWNTRAPVRGLGEAEGATSADVSTNDVLVAVGDGLETTVLDQDVSGGASAADSGGGVRGVEGASDDEVDQLAGVAEGQVEALLAVDAPTKVVNGSASVTAEPDASVSDGVVEIGGVALRAVLVTVPGEAASLRNLLLGSGSDQEEAEGQLEQVVHVYC